MEWPGFEPRTSSIRRGRSIHSWRKYVTYGSLCSEPRPSRIHILRHVTNSNWIRSHTKSHVLLPECREYLQPSCVVFALLLCFTLCCKLPKDVILKQMRIFDCLNDTINIQYILYMHIAWFNLLFDSVLLRYSISKQIDWICYVWFESRFDKQIKIGSTFILHSCWALDECSSVDFRRLSTRHRLFCRSTAITTNNGLSNFQPSVFLIKNGSVGSCVWGLHTSMSAG